MCITTSGMHLSMKSFPVNEVLNSLDHYAVAVVRDDVVVGHLPKKISRICSLFLRTGGTIRVKVIGLRIYSSDLAQGGMEISCLLFCQGEPKEIKKLIKLLFD